MPGDGIREPDGAPPPPLYGSPPPEPGAPPSYGAPSSGEASYPTASYPTASYPTASYPTASYASPPPYGQTYVEQPDGQAPYGQAPYAEAPYGQAPYGQAPYGQQPYGQAPYGPQPPYGPGYGPPAPVGLPPGVQVASMGRRLAARLIDLVLMTGLVAILTVLLVTWIGATVGFSEGGQGGEGGDGGGGGDLAAGLGTLGFFAAVILGVPAYEIVMIALCGATVGKLVTRVRVVRVDPWGGGGLQPPGWGFSMLRYLLPFLGSWLFVGQFVVYLSPFFDSTGANQGWHDKIAGTYVVTT
jgi:uncharacterized RDD family membrane protein YckC